MRLWRSTAMQLGVSVACAVAMAAAAAAQTAAPAPLPLKNLGLEHLDILVPDTAASARFYSRIFRTKLHQQTVGSGLRYFVLLGDLPPDRQIGYVAIGAAQARPTSIGHYCVLAEVYDRAGMGRSLEAAGFPGIRGAGGLGMWPDPDGLELQLFQPPAGLVTAAVPSPLEVAGDGLVRPLGVDHVLLRVSSLERALPYYRTLYGAAAERPRDPEGRVWFHLERDTRLALRAAAAGQPPAIEHYAIKVAPFDRAAVTSRLRELGVRTLPSPDEPDVLRFEDNNGIVVELRVAP
jgi:catechol 2,3-dioxygenase-like lactoylglutathione lyase family enzyme